PPVHDGRHAINRRIVRGDDGDEYDGSSSVRRIDFAGNRQRAAQRQRSGGLELERFQRVVTRRRGCGGIGSSRGSLAGCNFFLVISKVCRRDVGSESEAFDASVLEPQRAAAKLLDVIHAVGTEQQSSTVLQALLAPRDALAV